MASVRRYGLSTKIWLEHDHFVREVADTYSRKMIGPRSGPCETADVIAMAGYILVLQIGFGMLIMSLAWL